MNMDAYFESAVSAYKAQSLKNAAGFIPLRNTIAAIRQVLSKRFTYRKYKIRTFKEIILFKKRVIETNIPALTLGHFREQMVGTQNIIHFHLQVETHQDLGPRYYHAIAIGEKGSLKDTIYITDYHKNQYTIPQFYDYLINTYPQFLENGSND